MAQHQILAIPHKVSLAHDIINSRTLFIYQCFVETVKLNFHLELHVTLVSNLNSGLCLELQVCCVLASHKVWTGTGLPHGFPAVWSIYVVLHGLS